MLGEGDEKWAANEAVALLVVGKWVSGRDTDEMEALGRMTPSWQDMKAGWVEEEGISKMVAGVAMRKFCGSK